MSRDSRNEADRVRDDQIAWLRWQVRLLLGVLVLGTLAAVLGGPAAVQALQVLQGVLP